MAKIKLDLSQYDSEIYEEAMDRVEVGANVIRDGAREILKSKLVGNWREHGPYKTGKNAGQPWTERMKAAMVKTIRTVRSKDRMNKTVWVMAGEWKHWWAVQMEYGRGEWKGGARSFMRPALSNKGKIVAALESGSGAKEIK